MAQWNLSVDLRATGDQLARELTSAANASRALGREARRAQRDVAALGRAANRTARDLRDLRNNAITTAGALGIVGQTSRRSAREIRNLDTNAARATRSARTLGTAQQQAATHAGTYSTAARALNNDLRQLDQTSMSLARNLGGSGSSGMSGFGRDAGNAAGGADHLRKALLALLPALVPIAAQAAPLLGLAGSLGAAGVSAGAFGAAIAGQVSSLSEAAEAQTKYEQAVAQSGARSEEALKAQGEYLALLKKMPPETRRAAAAYSELRTAYQDWSDSLAGDTMPVAIKGMGLLQATIPKLTPLVKDSSREFEHMLDVIAGASQTPGLDSLIGRLDKFATRTLSDATTGAVGFARSLQSLDTGPIGQDYQEFMAYARANGPLVADTVEQIVSALLHLLVASSDVGVSVLQIVNVLAKLVNAVPTGAITALLQLGLALKAVQLAAAGSAAIGAAFTAIRVQGVAAAGAAAGASGALGSLRAAFLGLSRGAQVALAGTGIGLLVIALASLSNIGKKAPPDVDKMTTSLGRLGRTGKVTGEAARVFGKDLGGLAEAMRGLSKPSNLEKTQQFLTRLIGMDSTPVKKWKEDLDGADKALAGMVKNGNADLAAAAFDRIAATLKKQGYSASEVRGKLDDYTTALANQKLEAELAAAGMGLFGKQALDVKTKLDAQKQSADGLRQSIQALNDVNRAGAGAMNAFEAAIDDTAKAAKDNSASLRMVHGELDLNGKKARDAESALRDLAGKTDEAASSARESGKSWQYVNGIYDRGRDSFVKSAQAMGLSRKEADQLAASYLQIPDAKKVGVEIRTEDAVAGLNSVINAIKKTPDRKTVTVKSLTTEAIGALESVGYTVEQLPDGRFSVTADTGKAKAGLGDVQALRNGLKDKSLKVDAYTQGAIEGLDAVIAAVKRTPSSHSVRVKSLTGSAIEALDQLGYRVTHLKDGSFSVSARTGAALGNVQAVQAARDRLSDRAITISVTTYYRKVGSPTGPVPNNPVFSRPQADGSVLTPYADGGIPGVRAFANGSERHVAQFARPGDWRVWAEPETGGEAYIPLARNKWTRSRAIAEETVRRLGGKGVAWNADGSVLDHARALSGRPQAFASGGFSYSPTDPVSTLGAGAGMDRYTKDVQKLKDAWDKLNTALKAQSKTSAAVRDAERNLSKVRSHKHTVKQLQAAEEKLAKARKANTAASKTVKSARSSVNSADATLGLRKGAKAPSSFNLKAYQLELSKAAKANASWESNLAKIGKRAGADVADTLRGMGDEGRSLVSALAKASTKQFNAIVANLRKLAPVAKATLADYTKQLTAANKVDSAFQQNLVKLAGMGYGDLATQLAGQGDEAAQQIAAQAVKSKTSASKANAEAKKQAATLSSDEMAELIQIIAATKTSKTGLHDVAASTGLGEDVIIAVATKAASQIKSSLGSRATRFLSDLGKAQKGLAYADGGIREGIYATRGGAVTFAEPSTGGEAYIPLGQAKRGKALNVLGDVAGRFGVGLTPATAAPQIVVVREQGPLVGTQNLNVSGVGNPVDVARRVDDSVAYQLRRLSRGGARR